jgi:tRNA A-37 threonylcarbamoyl transferase component Bud32
VILVDFSFVYIDADMAKKGVDCVKIIQSFYAMMEDKIERNFNISMESDRNYPKAC